jgi:hypothetical protein
MKALLQNAIELRRLLKPENSDAKLKKHNPQGNTNDTTTRD